MKKNIFLFPFLLTLVSCATQTSTSLLSSTNSIDSTPSTSSIKEEINVEKILEKHYASNITYHSDVKFYYYAPTDYENVHILQHYDVYAKYTPNRFTFKSYIYGSSYVYSSFYLEKEESGFVTSKTLNINNEVVSTTAMTSSSTPLIWDESIYKNDLLTYISMDDLTLQDDGTYLLTSDTAFEWLETVAASCTDTSNLSASLIESGVFSFFDDGSMTLTIQEKESDEVYAGYMYGRTITISFEDVGSTEISDFTNYPSKEENNSLSLALNKMKEANNYSYTLTSYVNNEKKQDLEIGYVGNTDIFRKEFNIETNGYIYEGYHTYKDNLYSFYSSSDTELIGTKVSEPISSFLPDFEFSSDLFTLKTETNGVKTYEIMDFPTIVDHITPNKELSGSYYNGNSDPIQIKIDSSNNVESIIIPANIVQIKSNVQTVLYGYYEIKYVDINTTTFDNLFSNFISEEEAKEITSWDSLCLSLTSTIGNNPKEIMNHFLGENETIPFFLPSSIKTYSEVSYDSEVQGIFIIANQEATSEELSNISSILVANSFVYDDSNAIFTKTFTNGMNVDISIMNESGFSVEIYFYSEE